MDDPPKLKKVLEDMKHVAVNSWFEYSCTELFLKTLLLLVIKDFTTGLCVSASWLILLLYLVQWQRMKIRYGIETYCVVKTFGFRVRLEEKGLLCVVCSSCYICKLCDSEMPSCVTRQHLGHGDFLFYCIGYQLDDYQVIIISSTCLGSLTTPSTYMTCFGSILLTLFQLHFCIPYWK